MTGRGVTAAIAAVACATLVAQDPQPAGDPGRGPGSLAALAPENDPELTIAVEAGGTAADQEIGFGEPFPVTVRRSWPAAVTPAPFDESELAPLLLERTAGGPAGPVDGQPGRVGDSHTFTARVFRRGAVTLRPTIVVPPTADEPARTTVAEPVTLFLESALPADDDGTAELLDVPLRRPRPWRRMIAVAALSGLGATALAWASLRLVDRRRRSVAAGAETGTDRRAELAALVVPPADDPAARRDDARRLEHLLRRQLAAVDPRFVPSLTDAELVATAEASTRLSPADRERVRLVADYATTVRYAGSTADRAAATAALAALLDAHTDVERANARGDVR